MKRKTLTTAVLAGLTGMAGMVSVSNAVNLNPDGVGQVLLYPFYSARGGNDTLISIVNTTENAKSVKIRFLESLNSQEVLDFNIYMSKFDVWVAAVTDNHPDLDGPGIIIPDSTCTVPYIFANSGGADFGVQPFLTLALDDTAVAAMRTEARTASGHIEVIEMGTLVDLTNGSATAATHGPTFNCQKLVDAWTTFVPADPAKSYWLGNPDIDHLAPSGGLFGGGSIINVEDGTMFSYNAVAIDAFSSAILHEFPGTVLPNLAEADSVSNVFVNGTVVTDDWDGVGLNAVNAVLMLDTLFNEYVTGGITAARSEWVVTFPTKRQHVAVLGAPFDPFTSVWDTAATGAGACEKVFLKFWDREENTPAPEEFTFRPPVSPSPDPEDPEEPEFNLCWEANVLRFGSSEDLPAATEILNEPLNNGSPSTPGYLNINTEDFGFFSGWVRFSFNSVDPPEDDLHTLEAPLSDNVYFGLPAIGFWVNTFTNNTLVDDAGVAVLANYGGSFQHRGSRKVTS